MFVADIDNLAGYGLVAYGNTPEEAMRLLRLAARKFARHTGVKLERDFVNYYGATVSEVHIGHVYIDGGRAGEVLL